MSALEFVAFNAFFAMCCFAMAKVNEKYSRTLFWLANGIGLFFLSLMALPMVGN